MTATKTRHAKPGEQFHVVREGLSMPDSNSLHAMTIALRRGDEHVVTDQLLDATRDRLGATWLDLIHDEEEQLRRWGEVKLAFGPRPHDFAHYDRGSVEALLERERRRLGAMQSLVGTELKLELAKIDAQLGVPRGVTTLRDLDGGR